MSLKRASSLTRESSTSKKAKLSPSASRNSIGGSSNNGPLNDQPTNKVLPENIEFPAKTPSTLRIAAFNVCGLSSARKKGFDAYLAAEDPDILVLTETKANSKNPEPTLAKRFPYSYWSLSDKKSYGGTAVLSKKKPISVSTDLPNHPNPSIVSGRIITLEFEKCFLVGTYVVNAGVGLKTLDAKKEWNAHFQPYICDLDTRKPVIWCGDLNVAPTALDLANPKTNWNKTAGYTEAETTAFRSILQPEDPEKGKFLDIWRTLHPDTRHYTYFSYRFNCRGKGLGWRIDMFVLSERLKELAKMCEIRSNIYGASDHCPLVLEIDETAF